MNSSRDGLRHVEAVGGGARLADVPHLREQRALDGLVEVGVVEDRNGAFPPSSIETFQHVLADAWAIRVRPTSVEPVNESFRSRGILDQRTVVSPARTS